MSRPDSRRPSPIREEKPSSAPASPEVPPTARDWQRWGWGVAFLTWAMAVIFLVVLLLHDLFVALKG
jgi:hypothetical protein